MLVIACTTHYKIVHFVMCVIASLDCIFRTCIVDFVLYGSASQPPGRGLVPGPSINYTGQREVLLEFVILVF